MPPTKPTLRYAQADTDARFQVSEDLIYIEQRPPMLSRVFVWTIAAGMIALRLLRNFPQIESRLGIQQIGAQSWGSELLYVPPGSVVVSGSLPSADGTHSLYCAVIVKQVDAKTRSKTSINELLRG